VATQLASQPAPEKVYRVVQWATGNVGSRALRRAIEASHLDLVGLWVHSKDKAGKDAGELAGVGPVGVKATNSIDDILALKADCVVYMPGYTNFDEIVAILESGTNIVTTRGDFHHPAYLDPAVRARIEAACQRGNTSIHSTGCSPGFITEALPLVLATLERRIDHIDIQEYADCSSRDSPDMLFNIMGFGMPPGADVQARLDHLKEAFGPSMAVCAEALGLPFDEITVDGGMAPMKDDVEIAVGTIKAGTVGAQRTTVTGMRNGKPLISFTANWFVSTNVLTPNAERWDLREASGWKVTVQGDVPLKVEITYPVAIEDYAEMTPGLTAHRPLNIIPYIVEAPAGIMTSADLPQILTKLA
jgi:4-hydroxy-tetrahydrodipicolinate reductase